MNTDIENIEELFAKEIQEVKDLNELEVLKIKYLGRKGLLANTISQLANLPIEEKRKFGPLINKLKAEISALIDEKYKGFRVSSEKSIDLTKPGSKISLGHKHILAQVEETAKKIFLQLNFSVVDGPEIENEYYNFDALNIPPDHPAREMWDTFWLKSNNQKLTDDKKNFLLRTHTSPMQVRYMESHNPPIQIVVPGRVFRYEATDASHEINFYQLEGLMVSKDINLANFKFIIEEFFKRFFKQEIEFRYRPSYFPFVEPGIELDIKIRGSNKWLEVMGAGMVHNRVFEYAHYNPGEFQGFAFGLGLDRLAMIKYKIPDIRLFYSGDLRFIKQF